MSVDSVNPKALIDYLKLTGLKVYIAGAGQMALGVYQITESQYEEGVQNIVLGFGVCGLRAMVKKNWGK